MKVVALAALALAAGCHRGGIRASRGEAPVRTSVVHRGDVSERVLLTGALVAASSVELTVPHTETWELAIRWLAEDGGTVKAGDRVVEFDNSAFTSKLEEKHLAELEAAMTFRTFQDVTALDLADKQAQVDQAQIALSKAKVLAAVPPDLLPARTAQDRQLDEARAQVAFDKAQRELAAARDAAALEGKVKQIDLDKAKRAVDDAEHTIAALVLTAPRDGVVVIGDHPWEGHKFHVGDTVQPGMTIATLPDFSQPMQVHAELSDVDDGQVAVGMAGACTLDAYPADPMPCTVKDLAPVARARDRKSLRRSFAVVLTLDKSDPDRMRPGMSVKVELRRSLAAGALLVPRGAVVFGKTARVRLPGGELRDVALGPCDAQACAVAHGLDDGQAVALGGSP